MIHEYVNRNPIWSEKDFITAKEASFKYFLFFSILPQKISISARSDVFQTWLPDDSSSSYQYYWNLCISRQFTQSSFADFLFQYLSIKYLFQQLQTFWTDEQKFRQLKIVIAKLVETVHPEKTPSKLHKVIFERWSKPTSA